MSTIIVQRVVPHYRLPLFRALHSTYGIRVVAAAEIGRQQGLKLVALQDEPFFVSAPIRFPSIADPFAATFPMQWILETLRPTTVISEFSLRQSTVWQLPMARSQRRIRKLVFWTHGWQMERGFSRPADLAVQYGRLLPFWFADAIATYSEEGAAWVRRLLPRRQVVALGNTIDITGIEAAGRTARPERHGAPQLLAIGRMTADKALDLVIDAFETVAERYPDAALTIIGDGAERAKLEAKAGARLGTSIRMPGAIYDETELAPHFLGADAYVLAGAAGLSVNHALAYALPIVAFTRSAKGPRHHPEIEYVRDGVSGILLRAEDGSGGLGRVIGEAYAAGQLQAMRERMRLHPPVPTIDDMVARFGELL